jgi:hypothetical protein
MIPFKYTIDDKQEITTADGDKIIDLAAPSIKPDQDINVLDYYIVRQSEEGRSDKLAMRYYGNVFHTEIMLKFNGVSNPFSVEEGDIMIVADPVSGRQAMISQAVVNRGDIRKQYYQPEKEGKPDPRLKTFEKRQTVKPNKKKDGPALPPNFSNPGDKEIQIIGGKLVFGANVSRGGTGTSDVPLEKQKFLDNLKNLPNVKKAIKTGNALKTGDKYNNPAQNAAGNNTGVKNANLTPDEEKKLAAQKAAREKAKKDLLSKVNLSKSELIAKLVKELYKPI